MIYSNKIPRTGEEIKSSLVTMFLLPEGTTVGSRLVRKVMEWSLT